MNQELPEEIGVNEQIRQSILADLDNGLKRMQTLLQQLARGADVANEIEEVKESLYQRIARGIEDSEAQSKQNEYGGMDEARFDTNAEPAYIRTQREGN